MRLTYARREYVAWILLYMELLILFERTGGSALALDFQSVYRIALVGAASLILVPTLLSRSESTAQLLRRPLSYMLMFAVVAMASTAYASVGFYALWKAVEILVVVGAVAVVLGMPDQIQATTKLYRLTLILIGLTGASVLIGLVAWPEMALRPEGGIIPFQVWGVVPALNPNTVGCFGALCAFAAFVRMLQKPRNRLGSSVLFVAFLLLLIFSTSRTALAGFICALLVFSIFDRRRALMVGVIGLILGVALVGALQEFAVELFRKGEGDATLQTLSGRTIGWAMAWETFLKSPWFGHGIASAGRFDVLGGGPSSTLHGSLFDVLVGVGLVGTIPWLLAIISVGWMLLTSAGKRGPDRMPVKEWLPLRAELLGIYTILFVRGITSSVLATQEREFMLLLSLLAISMATVRVVRHQRSEAATAEPEEDPPSRVGSVAGVGPALPRVAR